MSKTTKQNKDDQDKSPETDTKDAAPSKDKTSNIATENTALPDNPEMLGIDLPPAECYACHTPFEDFYYLGQKHGFDLIGCLKCGTVVIDPYPTPEMLEKYYNDYKGTTDYAAKKDKKIARCTKRIQKLMNRTNGKRFLDVGCNYGFAVEAAKQLGLESYGIDIDPKAIEFSQKTFGKSHFETIAVEDYAKKGKQADIIYTSEVIEHLHDPESFVAALKDILAPGGIIYLTTPDGNHFMIPSHFPGWSAVIPPEHIHYFSRKGLKAMFARHDMKVDKFFFNFKPGIRMVISHADTAK